MAASRSGSRSTSTRSSSLDTEQLQERLAVFLRRSHDAASVQIEGLRLLTGGASRETWAFDAVIEDAAGETATLQLVLRRDPRRTGAVEYGLLKLAGEEGVPVAKVHLECDDSFGAPSFLMERVEGETIPRRLLRDDAYAEARASMTGQLGAVLARVHRLPLERARSGARALTSPAPGKSGAETELDRYEQVYRAVTPDPHPAFELALRWLRQRLPEPSACTLVHGDYRLGNVMFGPEGVRAILDWELAHVGDPVEDLGWFCVRSWRFGNDELTAGGIGTREDLVAAYEAAGGARVDPDHLRFWEAYGNFRWGVSCIAQANVYLGGHSASVELASIGRRIAETEWELLQLITDGHSERSEESGPSR